MKRSDNDESPNQNLGRYLRAASFWVLIFLIPLAIYELMGTTRQAEKELTYTEFSEQLASDNISSVTIIEGKRVEGVLKTPLQERGQSASNFTTLLPTEATEELLTRFEQAGVDVEARESGPDWVSYLGALLPWLLIIGLWIFLFRQMQSGGSRAFSFGKSKAKLLTGDTPKVTFADVAGADEAKADLVEIIDFLKDPAKFRRLGGRLPKGALLVGPPGTGKTLLARAVAGEAGRPFFSMSGSDFVEMFVGVGASVTGDTPVLVRDEAGTRLVPIAAVVDPHYQDGEADRVVPVFGVEALGYESGSSGFRGGLDVFGGSAWQPVRGVYRHRVDEVYEIDYLGGTVRTTGDHSVFVRGHGGIRAKQARELEPGDVLVNLPFHVRGGFDPSEGTKHETRAHPFGGDVPTALPIEEVDENLVAAHAFAIGSSDRHSQAELADMIGVSQATIGNWQSGKHMPRGLSNRYDGTDVPGDVPVGPSLLRLMGLYTAGGRANGNLELCFGTHEAELIAEAVGLVEELFGREPKRVDTDDNATRLVVHSAPLGRFFARHCGNGSRDKHVPELLWDAPRELFHAYLEGYGRGDGWTSRDGRLLASSVSQRLIRELAWLCAMHGIPTGIRHQRLAAGRVIKRRPLPETESWTLIVGKSANPFLANADRPKHAQAGKRPVVLRVERVPHAGYVYDLCGCGNEAFFGGEKPVLLHNSRVRDLFEQGKAHAPCIIFIDEIDAVGRHRGAGLGGGHDEREQTLNQLLVEMDGFESNEGVILLAATNRPDVLDPALLRPGRFDRQIVVGSPDINGREGILRVHTKEIPLAEDVDLRVLAKGTPGLSGADLENIVNEAALLAARKDKDRVYMVDLEEAKDKIMLGAERRSLVISDEERKVTAFHEAGHAVIALRAPGLDPVHKVTIVPRGRALGITASLPEEDRHNYTKDWLEGQLMMLFGGRVAEEMVFGRGKITTGAGNDIERATNIARRMVTQFGMSDAIGPIAVGEADHEVFLGRELSQRREVSDRTAQTVDSEIKRILDEAYEGAHRVLTENRELLDRIANLLLERETLDADEIKLLDAGEELPPLEPAHESEPAPEPEKEAAGERGRAKGESPLEGTGGEPSPVPA